jgi:uncharacterized protein
VRWSRRARSPNVVDRRGGGGFGFPRGGLGRGGGLPPIPIGRAGLPALLLILVAAFVLPRLIGSGGFDVPGVDQFPRAQPGGEPIPRGQDPDADLFDFVSFVVDDVQVMWEQEFRAAGETYPAAKVVLFEGGTQTACGVGVAEVGPFYCPADRNVYLDLGFFQELHGRFGAPGDFAQAYVIAHEIGHHVQNVLGISDRVRSLQQQSPDEANELSIRLELQADCLAGVWGFTTKQRGLLEPGDLEEGLAAAAAVGDDRIQRQAAGRTNPETWTHGSSEQRVEWFSRGFDVGDPDRCDTFSGGI